MPIIKLAGSLTAHAAKVPATLAARIARVLGWFFEPELTNQTDSRIRNELRKRDRAES